MNVIHARYRCTACGNLTRFDVTTRMTIRAFHHYSVGGALSVEEQEVLDAVVEDVRCRWCGIGSSVEEIESLAGTAAPNARANDGTSWSSAPGH